MEYYLEVNGKIVLKNVSKCVEYYFKPMNFNHSYSCYA